MTFSPSDVQFFLHHHSLNRRQPALGKDSMGLIPVQFALCVTIRLPVTVLGGWLFYIYIIYSDPVKVQTTLSFLKTLHYRFYLVIAEKCNNPTPGDLSIVPAAEEHVCTVLWMQKACIH